MKKNIIMIIIILICSMSLLLVLYYFNSKNIYYISDKIIGNNEITMQIKNESTYTNLETLNDLDSSKYYRISNETNCSSGTASFYYSNSTNKLKLKVTSNPLKCKIVFEEIVEDINILSMYMGETEIENIPTSGWYDITYNCKNNNGTSSTATIFWDNETHKLSTNNITAQTYCTVTFIPKYKISLKVVNSSGAYGDQVLTNIAPNPSFEGAGWSCVYDSSYKLTGNYSCKIIADTSIYEGKVTSTTYQFYNKNHKYFFMVSILPLYSNPSSDIYFGLQVKNDILSGDAFHITSLVQNAWDKQGGFPYKINYNPGPENMFSYFRIDINNANQDAIQYFDDLTVIDLTADYGPGNEPLDNITNKNFFLLLPFFETNLSIINISVLPGESGTYTGIESYDNYPFKSLTCTNNQNITYNSGTLTYNNITSPSDCVLIFR